MRIQPKGTVNAKSAEAGKDLASRDDKTQPLPLLQDEPGDHSLSRHDVFAVSAFAQERGGPSERRRHRDQL